MFPLRSQPKRWTGITTLTLTFPAPRWTEEDIWHSPVLWLKQNILHMCLTALPLCLPHGKPCAHRWMHCHILWLVSEDPVFLCFSWIGQDETFGPWLGRVNASSQPEVSVKWQPVSLSTALKNQKPKERGKDEVGWKKERGRKETGKIVVLQLYFVLKNCNSRIQVIQALFSLLGKFPKVLKTTALYSDVCSVPFPLKSCFLLPTHPQEGVY